MQVQVLLFERSNTRNGSTGLLDCLLHFSTNWIKIVNIPRKMKIIFAAFSRYVLSYEIAFFINSKKMAGVTITTPLLENYKWKNRITF